MGKKTVEIKQDWPPRAANLFPTKYDNLEARGQEIVKEAERGGGQSGCSC